MANWISKDTRLVVQGFTGREGKFHALASRDYGTQLVAGVTPGKGGTVVDGIPVFDSVHVAVKATGANASMVFVPPPAAADAIMEASDAGVALIVAITEGVPINDMIKAKEYLAKGSSRLIGPNCPGIIRPSAKVKIGIMPARIHKAGFVGVVSRSGPPGRRMGHAGAIISGGKGTAGEKVKALKESGVDVADSPALMGETLKKLLGK